jgi:c-di-GMP-binding flagellar brake protein YcgR
VNKGNRHAAKKLKDFQENSFRPAEISAGGGKKVTSNAAGFTGAVGSILEAGSQLCQR